MPTARSPPTTFNHFFGTFIFWAMLMVGGSGNNKGAVLGAYVIWGFWTITLQVAGYDLPLAITSRIFFIRDFILGALIVVVLLLRPQGLLPEERRVSIWVERQSKGPPVKKQRWWNRGHLRDRTARRRLPSTPPCCSSST